MKLLCDEMLGGLARWLRAAGHDAAVAPRQASDADLIAIAEHEGRILISRDRALVARARGRAQAVLLVSEGVDAQALELDGALGLDWTLAPFTRCMMDNADLRPATAAEIAALPDRTRALPGPFRACPACGRLYWPGSHVRRMLERLQAWKG